MIEMKLTLFGQEYAIVRIDNMLDHFDTDLANYSVTAALRGPVDDSLWRRTLTDIEKYKTNPLGLLKAALDRLPEEAFHGEAFPSNMARRQPDRVPKVQAGPDQLHSDGSTLRGGQPVQHGGDQGGQGVRSEDRGRRQSGRGFDAFLGRNGRTPSQDG